ncbi:response regulator [Desulfitobacterium sp. AusDCA]|uniref:response regulator n=1 Tax=Desulfitobacterium sp. AusDCA TaxID=3240383 RepID=UPI003DA73782
MAEYILIVDDELTIRYMLQEFLREAGYRTKGAADGSECFKIAQAAEKPSLILLDYQMPGMTGPEVLSMLKKESTTQEIPVIMISGTENPDGIAMNYGAYAVLKKPLNLKALMEAIHNVLDESFDK